MRSRLFGLALVACVPAVAFAQKGKGGASDPSSPSSSNAAPMGKAMPSARDLSDMNPAALLLDKHKKLSLADSTSAHLKAVVKMINARNAQFFATYDSVHKWTVPLSSSSSPSRAATYGFADADKSTAAAAPSAAEQAKMQSSMKDLRAMVADFRERRRADITDALAVIPDAQKKAATDLLDAQDKDVEKMLGGR